MTAPRTPPSGQLDIPLVWDTEPVAAGRGAPAPQPEPQGELAPLAGAVRLWLAVLADAGVVVLTLGVFWGVAGLIASGLAPAQFALATAAGMEGASVIALGCLWGWRATPGMLLLGVCFSRPVPFARACRLWLLWLASLPLLGLPLLLRRRGRASRRSSAGGTLSFRSTSRGRLNTMPMSSVAPVLKLVAVIPTSSQPSSPRRLRSIPSSIEAVISRRH